jgi:hypothetical protein
MTITGYETLLYQNGAMVATGFSPVTFSLSNGQTYAVQVDDYGSCHFDHWADTSSTNNWRNVVITSDTTLTAIYNCSGSPSSVTVNSVDQNANAIFGYYAVLFDSGANVLASGFTTKTFQTTNGQTYSVQVDSYGSCTFAKWSDGVTTDPRSFTATSGPLSFTAVYNCGTSTTSTINISTVNSGGTQISGYYITLWQNGVPLQSCFSACSFTVNNGQTYQLAAASYGSETFDHWQNDGSTGFETVNVPSTSTTTSLTAVYNP